MVMPPEGAGRTQENGLGQGEMRNADNSVELNFRSLFNHLPDLITVFDGSGTPTYTSPSVAGILGYSPSDLLGRNPLEFIHPAERAHAKVAFNEVRRGAHPREDLQLRIRRADGAWIWMESIVRRMSGVNGGEWTIVSSREITKRKEMERQMGLRLTELTALNAVAQISLEGEDETALITKASVILRDAFRLDHCALWLLDGEQRFLWPCPPFNCPDPEVREKCVSMGEGLLGEVALTGVSRLVDGAGAEEGAGTMHPPLHSQMCVPLLLGRKVIGVLHAGCRGRGVFSEEDERVLSSLAIHLARAIGSVRSLKAALDGEERLRRLSESAFEGICLSDEGRIIDCNLRFADMLGYHPHEMIGLPAACLVVPAFKEIAEERIERGAEEPCELVMAKKNGETLAVEIQARFISLRGKEIRATCLWDITERKRAEEQHQIELERLAALRAIDSCIMGREDLKTTLDVVLEKVVHQLNVDAAAVFLKEGQGQGLRLAAAKGMERRGTDGLSLFPMKTCEEASAIAERMSCFGDLTKAGSVPMQSHLLTSGERFDYCAVPLRVKEKMRGVLELFHRKAFAVDQEWVNFLETLAGQAAIAIDHLSLLEKLEHSNAELQQSYDHIIEGWSRALELRDRETQGHALRVAEMTVCLLKELGVPKKEWVRARRGALLHDIGKMGIPDSILLKPGPLTEEEWVIMRRHVEYALHLLSPIEFLRPALDIPHCHHERWDGGGYPRGIEGDAIPLAARAFSVVDTWDALSHERPYRSAWPEARIIRFLREQSGKAYDPSVVEVFLRSKIRS